MRCHTQFLGRKQKRAWSKKPYSYIYAAEPLDSLIQFFPKGAISLGTLEDINDPRTGRICLLLWIVQKKVAAICQINNHQLGNCHGLIQSKQRFQQGKRINQTPLPPDTPDHAPAVKWCRQTERRPKRIAHSVLNSIHIHEPRNLCNL